MLTYTWDDFITDARAIASAVLRQRLVVDAIYGIPRGGLVLATYLSHTLVRPMIVGDVAPHALRPNTLVVDDNTVTGFVLQAYVDAGFATAALVHNPTGSAVTPRFIGRTSPLWPLFPWEIDSIAARRVA